MTERSWKTTRGRAGLIAVGLASLAVLAVPPSMASAQTGRVTAATHMVDLPGALDLADTLGLAGALDLAGAPDLADTLDLAEVVRAREVAFASTMADRDHDAFLDFISPEAVFFAGDRPLRGRDVIAEAWAPFFEGPTAPFSWHPDVVEVLESGSLALSSGPVRDPDGNQVGRFNTVWRLDAEGRWRVVFDKGS